MRIKMDEQEREEIFGADGPNISELLYKKPDHTLYYYAIFGDGRDFSPFGGYFGPIPNIDDFNNFLLMSSNDN